MVTAAQAVDWHRKQQPYRDNGGSSMWMRGEVPHWPGSAWCGKTQAVCAYDLGLEMSPTTAARVVYVPNAVVDAQNGGKRITSYQSHMGDWVIFDWMYSGRRDGLADHIGMIVRNDPSLPYVDTVEGNTLDSDGVGPRGLFFRRRYRVDILCCIDRQHVYTSEPTPVPPTVEDQDLNKWVDAEHIRKLQTVLKVEADGIAGKITYTALQKALGTVSDGVISAPASRAVVALQKEIGLKGEDVDGILGKVTGAKLEQYLDKGGNFVKPTPTPTPTPKPTPTPTPKPVPPVVVIKYVNVTVDGVAGPVTIKTWQKFEGTTQDGIISGQDGGRKNLLPHLNWPTVQWQGDGSKLIAAFQKRRGLSADGIIGPKTAKAIQAWVGVTQDGILGTKSVAALQKKLNTSVEV